ncbi:MAG TPA: protein-methionine-sulfoxide reductase heme-binding subunit MsrQ [Anaeromyxobacteraceae bacterium]|jgi:sulfoxide reductase heme-binding subunit YedZ|nr:protein-methionine-sulfoxide reductase heme-binding subunit MsrQ [Anaeromyxobacteraceae bacterium]
MGAPTPATPAPAAEPRAARRKQGAWPWLVPLAWAAGLLPLAKLVYDGVLTPGLGANPIEKALNRLGFWTLTFLTLSLVPTPAKAFLGLSWPVRIRRALGLLAFLYACLHFTTYVAVDQFFDWQVIGADLTKRPFIIVGFATLLVLVPLALTSTDAMVRRLGYLRWKQLHRLAYAAGALAIVHFLWRVKRDHTRPLLFGAAIGTLFALRGLEALRRRARRRPPVVASTGPSLSGRDAKPD